MSKLMNKYKNELNFLTTSRPITARLLFKHLPEDFIFAIVAAVWTTLSGKLSLKTEAVARVKSVQPTLRRIASRGQTVNERRTVLTSWRGVKAIKTLFDVLKDLF